MKQHLLTLLCGMLSVPVFAQKPDSTLAMAHYKFSHVRDTNNRDKPYTENMVLLIGQNASVYKSYDRKMQMEAMKKDAMAQMQNGTGQIKITSRGASTTAEIFQFPNEGKLIRKESIITSYLIDEPFPNIQWKISADTITIRNLSCQKATTHFKGRNYTAWFCADLPYRSGPWKLTGLPGLIVEAYDAKHDVEFKFDGIEQVTKTDKPAEETPAPGSARFFVNGMGGNDNPAIIALPDNGVRTTAKEFENLREAMRKDPQAFMQSAMAGSGMNMRPAGGTVVTGGPMTMNVVKKADGPAMVINNPLELPDKK